MNYYGRAVHWKLVRIRDKVGKSSLHLSDCIYQVEYGFPSFWDSIIWPRHVLVVHYCMTFLLEDQKKKNGEGENGETHEENKKGKLKGVHRRGSTQKKESNVEACVATV